MSVVVLTGSHRSGSFSRHVARVIAQRTENCSMGIELTQLPYFNQDLESEPPGPVQQLREQVDSADVLVIVTPEYNGAVPGVLGNALDWLSRPYERGVLIGKPVVAVTASPGAAGGSRALAALTTVLGNIGADTIAQLAIGTVDTRLTPDGLDEDLIAQLRDLVDGAPSAARAA